MNIDDKPEPERSSMECAPGFDMQAVLAGSRALLILLTVLTVLTYLLTLITLLT